MRIVIANDKHQDDGSRIRRAMERPEIVEMPSDKELNKEHTWVLRLNPLPPSLKPRDRVAILGNIPMAVFFISKLSLDFDHSPSPLGHT